MTNRSKPKSLPRDTSGRSRGEGGRSLSPHPGPLPLGEGESFATWVRFRNASISHRGESNRDNEMSERVGSYSLSLRERVRVRGNEASRTGRHCVPPTISPMAG